MPFDSLLSERKNHLTTTQQRAMKYITENYEETIFLTSSSLSRRIGVSEATIVRHAWPVFPRKIDRTLSRISKGERNKDKQ